MGRQKSFARGFCRAFDFGARNKDTLNITVKISSKDAILKDWENVGKSITAATRVYDSRGTK